MLPTITESPTYDQISEVLSIATDTVIPTATFAKLETPAGDVNNPIDLVGGVLYGYSRATDSGGYFVDVQARVLHPKRENLEFQRQIYQSADPKEVVRDALSGLVHMVQNPKSGHRQWDDRFDRHLGQ